MTRQKLYIIDIINRIDKLAIIIVIRGVFLSHWDTLDGVIILLEIVRIIVSLARDKVGIYVSFDILRDLRILYRLRFRLVDIIGRFRKFKSGDLRKIRIVKRR